MDNTTAFTISNKQTPIVLIISFSLMIFFYIIISAFLKLIQKDKYKGIQFTTKNIAYMTMLISSSVVLTIVISVIIPVTVFPPIRIAIEGLMIKITGYMFGPVVGVVCATITDLLVMIFVPSYINPVYIFCVVLTGFVAGLAGVLKNKLHNHSWIIFLLINTFMLIFSTIFIYTTTSHPGSNIELGLGMTISKPAMVVLFCGGVGISFIIFYCFLFYLWKNDKKQLLKDILPIILLVVFSEYMITVMLASYADMQLISPGNKDYGLTMITRAVMVPLKIIVNTSVIYLTWKTVSPLLHIDRYTK